MYWLVSLPLLKDSREETWRTLQGATGNGDQSKNYRFELPMSLRVGSLDKLMVLSDDLSRVNIMVEGVVNKIRRQASDLAPDQPLTVNNRPVASYLTAFSWDEAKYPIRKPLQEIVEELSDSVVAVDDDLKAKISEYQGLKQAFQAANRKQGGSLAVKDLNKIIKPKDIISTENMATLVVTVPSYAKKDFMTSYETLSEMVVPRSAKVVAEDSDYTLVRVVLFKKTVDEFKKEARLKGCQSRDATPAEEQEAAADAGKNLEQLTKDMDSKKKELNAWCRSSYGDAFTAWIHICAVRLFVESVLRYGLPPKFLGAIMKPGGRHENKIRKTLAEVFGTHGAEFWKPDDDAVDVKGDMYPYVSFTLDLDG